ncbi:MAG TPA: glycosyltransferase [Bacteroidota bacterium]|nr:glycosyltransferase [Bacteroidota bacterium]
MNLVEFITVLMAVSAGIYVSQLALFMLGLRRLGVGSNELKPSVVVLVAARNEERVIADCLRSLVEQDYPEQKYSIVVIDDHSTDLTPAIVENVARTTSRVRLFHAPDPSPGVSPKVNALSYALSQTSEEIVCTTDADCVVGPGWISSLMKHFAENVGVVSGVTLFGETPGVNEMLSQFQSLDFFSQTACGAGAIGLGVVNNCNGSNMAFRRSAYEAAGGYAAIAHVNSGSDSLLAQRITAITSWRMTFSMDPDSHVRTRPLTSWRGVLGQRMRWAGQTPNYRPATLVFLGASFFLYLSLFISVPFSVVFWRSFDLPLVLLVVKMTVDAAIILYFMKLTHVRGVMKSFFLSELIHIPVVLLAVIGSAFGRFDWKGRSLRREMTVGRMSS